MRERYVLAVSRRTYTCWVRCYVCRRFDFVIHTCIRTVFFHYLRSTISWLVFHVVRGTNSQLFCVSGFVVCLYILVFCVVYVMLHMFTTLRFSNYLCVCVFFNHFSSFFQVLLIVSDVVQCVCVPGTGTC